MNHKKYYCKKCIYIFIFPGDFPSGYMVKNKPAMQETQVWSLGQEDTLEKEMATHFSILTWRLPWTGEPAGLLSVGLQRVGDDWVHTVLGWFRHKTCQKHVSLHLQMNKQVQRLSFQKSHSQSVQERVFRLDVWNSWANCYTMIHDSLEKGQTWFTSRI